MRVTVSVPATSANLGAGFDVFGLALDLCNDVTFTAGAGGVTWDGEGADELPTDGSDLVSATVGAVARLMGLDPPACAIAGTNRIPLERGLGSSSAATVAGVVGASVLLGLGWEHDPASVFAATAELEGHPDNAAPAVYGGFTIAMPDGSVERVDPHPALRPVVIVPPSRLATAEARAALPSTVPRVDAVFNIAHAALTVRALTQDPDLLPRALADRLHEGVRVDLSDLTDVVAALRDAGVPVCVSGAGPSLLAFELGGIEAVTQASLGVASSWRILRPGVRAEGFRVAVEDG
jgi:homoserine kinase